MATDLEAGGRARQGSRSVNDIGGDMEIHESEPMVPRKTKTRSDSDNVDTISSSASRDPVWDNDNAKTIRRRPSDRYEIAERMVDKATWGRTFAIGVGWFFASYFACQVVIFFSVWLALLTAILITIFVTYLTPYLCTCFYGKQYEYLNWKSTLGQVALIATVFGTLAGVTGGYFIRDYYSVVIIGKDYTNLPTTGTPKTDLGTAIYVAGAHAFPELGGIGEPEYGIFPACVAPILSAESQKKVSYWAVSQGSCCSTKTCDDWTSTLGGIRLRFTEFYPNVNMAIQKAKSTHGLDEEADVVLISWGKPSEKIALIKLKGFLIIGICFALCAALMLLRAFRGSSKKTPTGDDL